MTGIPLRGLELFHALYIIGIAFGLENASEALYAKIKKSITSNIESLDLFPIALLYIAIILLAVRFFWSTGNIGRAMTSRARSGLSILPAQIMTLHLPILLLQGTLILFVCHGFKEFLEGGVSVTHPISWFIVVTTWNAIWLMFLRLYSKGGDFEAKWVVNNVGFIVLSIFLLILYRLNFFGPDALLLLFVVFSIASSLFDLAKTAEHYLL